MSMLAHLISTYPKEACIRHSVSSYYQWYRIRTNEKNSSSRRVEKGHKLSGSRILVKTWPTGRVG